MKTIILNENNVQDFVRKIMELYETKIITNSEFISDNGKLKIKFEENNIPKIIEKNAETKLNFIVTHKPYRSLSKFVPFDNKSITVSNIF